jgi:membrane-bound lytic murein transglycosylase B
VHVRVSSRNRRPRSLVAWRRRLAAAAGAAGILALAGSQAVHPVATAYLRPDAAIQNQQLHDYTSPNQSALPGSPTVRPVPHPASVAGSTVYGLSSTAALTASGIPEPAYRAYLAAAAQLARVDPSCGLGWSVLAGIGRVESNHGRYGGSSIRADGLVVPPILGLPLDGSRPGTARVGDSDGGRFDGSAVTDRAVGPMQFLPATWKVYGGGGDPENINAAALAAGRYLCAGGASLATVQGRWAAVYRYNHSDSYVSLVLSLAASYASGKVSTFGVRPIGTPPGDDKGPSATAPGPPPEAAIPAKPVVKSTAEPTTEPTTEPTAGPSPKGTRTAAAAPPAGLTGAPTAPGSTSTACATIPVTPTITPTLTPSGLPAPTATLTPTTPVTPPTPTPTPTTPVTPTGSASPTSPVTASPTATATCPDGG